MKNNNRMGILSTFVILAVIGLIFTACDNGNGGNDDPDPREAFLDTWFADKTITGAAYDRTIILTKDRFEIQESNGGNDYLKFDIESWTSVITSIGTMTPGSDGFPSKHDNLADYPTGFTLNVKNNYVNSAPWNQGYYDQRPSIAIYLHKDGEHIILWWRTSNGVPLDNPSSHKYVRQ